MRTPDIGPKVAFQPPSDMTGGGGGSSTGKKLFIGLGIGCGVVLLIIGVLFAAGAFQALTCCNQVKGAAETSVAVEAFSTEFAANVAQGNHDAAYAVTTEEFKGRVNKDAFVTAIEAHRDRLGASPPRLFNMDLEQSGGDTPSMKNLGKGTWRMSYQFAGPQDTTMLVMSFGVIPKGEGEEQTFRATDLAFDERPRNLSMEPPAREVLEVHRLIQGSQYERAYNRLGGAFRNSTDQAAWSQFLDDAGPLLTSSNLAIREVNYTGNQATVMTQAQTADGKTGIIQWEVVEGAPGDQFFGWRVTTIAPMIAEANNDGPDEPVPSMPEETNGASGSTTGTAGTNGADAPEVKADFAE